MRLDMVEAGHSAAARIVAFCAVKRTGRFDARGQAIFVKAIAHPSAAEPGMICAIDVADKLLRLQSCGVEDRMVKGVLIVDQGGINVALGVQGDKAGVII